MRLFAECELCMTPPRTPLSIVVVLVTFFPVLTRAQGPAARDFLNTPVYATRFFFDFVNSSGETAAASDVPLPNNATIVRNGVVSLLYSFPLAGRYGGVRVSGGYATIKVNGPLGKVETSGFTDPNFTFHANFFGAPALRID